MNRRLFCRKLTVPLLAAAASRAAGKSSPLSRSAQLGIVATSFASAPFRDTVHLLELGHAYGAAGVQPEIKGDPARIRSRTEELCMWIEARISIHNGDPAYITEQILQAKAAGCSIGCSTLLAGSRYESFNTIAHWHAWCGEMRRLLSTAVPIFERHKFVLALENHRDWTLDEFSSLLRSYDSEYLGACLDCGNSIALLEDPTALMEGLGPFVKATHFKDIVMVPYEHGFLLSDAVLGTGLLDVPGMAAQLLRHNPKLHLSLEMTMRDPLEVPCLTDRYWERFPDREGMCLAQTLRVLKESSATALPRVGELGPWERARLEQENIRACFRYADQMRLS